MAAPAQRGTKSDLDKNATQAERSKSVDRVKGQASGRVEDDAGWRWKGCSDDVRMPLLRQVMKRRPAGPLGTVSEPNHVMKKGFRLAVSCWLRFGPGSKTPQDRPGSRFVLGAWGLKLRLVIAKKERLMESAHAAHRSAAAHMWRRASAELRETRGSHPRVP